MAKKDDGGPAFPNLTDAAERGISVRDYFAAKALTAVIAKVPLLKFEGTDGDKILPRVEERSPEAAEQIWRAVARLSYDYADAILAERSK